MNNGSNTARWISTQIGAREHYAVPRALHQSDRLDTLFTDYWAGPVTRGAAHCLPLGALCSLASRYHPDLTKAESWNFRAVAWEAKARPGRQPKGPYFGFIEVGQKFACAVRERLRCRRDFAANTIFFAYDTGALETLEYLKARRIFCIVDQMDPNRLMLDAVREEILRSPGWQSLPIDIPEAYFQRREKEWALADRIVVNSEFSRQALIRQGVPPGKLAVIPLCYEPKVPNGTFRTGTRRVASDFSASTPLKVLFLGQVTLLKGIRYLVEAAKLLKSEPIHFDVVGPIGISQEAVRSAPSNLTFHGRTNRDHASQWYDKADIFVLPTLSDGFALTQLEAMAHGLPVIATPNCGAVVTHDLDGLIVTPGDASALAAAIRSYVAEPMKLRLHHACTREKIGHFTLGHLARNLAGLETQLAA